MDNLFIYLFFCSLQYFNIFEIFNISIISCNYQIFLNSDSLCFILHNILQDVDPNDEKSMLLLERMAVMKNGKVYKVDMYILDVGDSSLCFTNMDLLGQLYCNEFKIQLV